MPSKSSTQSTQTPKTSDLVPADGLLESGSDSAPSMPSGSSDGLTEVASEPETPAAEGLTVTSATDDFDGDAGAAIEVPPGDHREFESEAFVPLVAPDPLPSAPVVGEPVSPVSEALPDGAMPYLGVLVQANMVGRSGSGRVAGLPVVIRSTEAAPRTLGVLVLSDPGTTMAIERKLTEAGYVGPFAVFLPHELSRELKLAAAKAIAPQAQEDGLDRAAALSALGHSFQSLA